MSHFGCLSPFHAHSHLVVVRHDDGSAHPIHPILFYLDPMALSISFVFEGGGCGGGIRFVSEWVLVDGGDVHPRGCCCNAVLVVGNLWDGDGVGSGTGMDGIHPTYTTFKLNSKPMVWTWCCSDTKKQVFNLEQV